MNLLKYKWLIGSGMVALATLFFFVVYFFFNGDYFERKNEDSKYQLVGASWQDVFNKPDGWVKGETKVLNDNFSYDDRAVYWLDQYRILDADPKSFHVLQSDYAADATHVYLSGYEKSDSGKALYLLDGADAQSFESLGGWYAKDKANVFYKGEKISGADPDSLESLGGQYSGYAKDRGAVYEYGEKVEGRDAASFRVFGNAGYVPAYTADKNGVYLRIVYGDEKLASTRLVEGADPATFILINDLYGKDAQHVFYARTLIPAADPATFDVLPPRRGSFDYYDYAKDAQRVYFKADIVQGADPNSVQFVPLYVLPYSSVIEDNHSAYIDGKAFSKQDLDRLRNGELPFSAKRTSQNCYLWDGIEYRYWQGDSSSVPMLSKSSQAGEDACSSDHNE